MYEDGTELHNESSNVPELQNTLQHNINKLQTWLAANRLKVKTVCMLIGIPQKSI